MQTDNRNKINYDLKRNYKFESELWRAIVWLAKDSKGIKSRLNNIYGYHLIYLNPEDIPQEIYKNKFIQVINKLTKNKTMSVEEAIHHLPFKSCRSVAGDICDVYDAYIHYDWQRHEIDKNRQSK